ncbi:hypothetical protein EVAR_43530_1 [Eumeta japonica]|uniref:Uncharacterized protein n=1 Tax=Eumeta variegata TaxID=151549 RepID=A0A4C1WBJ8_EUMVA|nr:hypothetical protein EVAR_43530_1 [Eumeta japonica]
MVPTPFRCSQPGETETTHSARCGARARGTSLNENLLTGPDLLQSLPAVLMKFRQHRVAVAADIKEMFLQIEIAEGPRRSDFYGEATGGRDSPPSTA